MALKATVCKATLDVADLDRNYYASHTLTLARHPSETDERMMLRLLAFALHASDTLEFTRGLCADDEPELWDKDPTGTIELWVDLGQPEEKRIRRACGRARQVRVYCYGGRSVDIWWKQNAERLSGLKNLRVLDIPADTVTALGQMAARNMSLQATIQEGSVLLTDGQGAVEVSPRHLL